MFWSMYGFPFNEEFIFRVKLIFDIFREEQKVYILEVKVVEHF